MTETAEHKLTLDRSYDAPLDAVWRAWTDPAQLAVWWGPHGMTTPECEIELKAGGLFRTLMRMADGTEFPSQGIYLEVKDRERLVTTDAYAPDWIPTGKPFMTAVTTFSVQNGKTRVVSEARHWNAEDRETHEKMGFHQGWGESADRLADYLAGRPVT